MTLEQVDLVLPATYDIVWSIIALTMLALFIVAFITWTKVDFGPGKTGLGWLVMMVIFPIIGSVAFLIQARSLPRRVKAPAAR